MKQGDTLLISTNDIDCEEVKIVDMCSNGAMFCAGETFEGWIPKIEAIAENDKDMELLSLILTKHMAVSDLKYEVRKLKLIILVLGITLAVSSIVNLL